VKAVVILVAGSAGQASVVYDACLASNRPVAGSILAAGAQPIRGASVPLLGDEGRLDDKEFLRSHAIVVGSGDAEIRRRFGSTILSRGGELATIIHPASTVSRFASVGAGSVVAANASVGPNARVGLCCIINTAASADHDDVLEDGVNLSPGVHLAGSVSCGEDAFLGIGAAVVPGIRIGRRAIVGAGATVIADVPDDVTVAGTPARIIRRHRSAEGPE
jgi:sugar O-acyltransferase (sialic acid O-acetyltransferase NeuD family)